MKMKNLTENNKDVVCSDVASRSSAPMSLQNCKIFPNPLCFKVFVGCCLELKCKMLEIIKRRLGDERLKCSINGLKAILTRRSVLGSVLLTK